MDKRGQESPTATPDQPYIDTGFHAEETQRTGKDAASPLVRG